MKMKVWSISSTTWECPQTQKNEPELGGSREEERKELDSPLRKSGNTKPVDHFPWANRTEEGEG